MALPPVQLRHRASGQRCIARVDGNELRRVAGFSSIYDAAKHAIAQKRNLAAVIGDEPSSANIDYDAVWSGQSEWVLLPAFDYPAEPARCLVTLTALNKQRWLAVTKEVVQNR